MTTIDRPIVQRVGTDSLRKTALIGGALYVLTFASSIPAVLLLLRSSVLSNPNYIVGPGPDTAVLLACLLDLINALAAVGTAVVLFPVVKRQTEAVALGFVGSRLLEAAVITTGVVSLLAVVTLRQGAAAAGADDAVLLTVGQSLVTVRDWTFVLGPILMSGVNALLLGSLMYRSGLVPRIIPLIGLIGAPLIIISAVALMFGVWTQASVWHGIAAVPIFTWELSLGVYLVVKGFKPSPITAGMVAADTRTPS